MSKFEHQGPIWGETEMAVGPVGDIFHQPVHTRDAEVMDMQGSPWKEKKKGEVWGEPRSQAEEAVRTGRWIRRGGKHRDFHLAKFLTTEHDVPFPLQLKDL